MYIKKGMKLFKILGYDYVIISENLERFIPLVKIRDVPWVLQDHFS